MTIFSRAVMLIEQAVKKARSENIFFFFFLLESAILCKTQYFFFFFWQNGDFCVIVLYGKYLHRKQERKRTKKNVTLEIYFNDLLLRATYGFFIPHLNWAIRLHNNGMCRMCVCGKKQLFKYFERLILSCFSTPFFLNRERERKRMNIFRLQKLRNGKIDKSWLNTQTII